MSHGCHRGAYAVLLDMGSLSTPAPLNPEEGLGQSRSADDVWLDWPTAHR
jgi:hypothetical protein